MKSLLFFCLLSVLHGIVVGVIKEYIYVSQKMNWTEGQVYCRQHYTDLASITTEEEQQKVCNVSREANNYQPWIGLIRNVTIWQWSDGKQLTFTKWFSGELNGLTTGQYCAVAHADHWHCTSCIAILPLICYTDTRFPLVKKKKTWDEALKHCRRYYTDLTFVDSTTPLDLLKIKTKQAQIASVWTGLRFLDGKWFWVNGMPIKSLVPLPSFPAQPYRCGAYNFNTSVWENRDCNEELNFICYF